MLDLPGRLSTAAFALLLFSIPGLAAEVPLHDGWNLQSACKVTGTGEEISKATYHPEGWIAASVPATVLAAQVAAGEIKDPYYGVNLRKIPGMSYEVGKNFSNLPMAEDSPYRCGWWYRKAFRIPEAERGKTLWLRFGGINYRADVWVNGKRIADQSQVAGAYRTYEFDVTGSAVAGAENVVAVEMFAPTENDLGINWVDWNPAPPDKDMGLWGPVSVATSGPVAARSPMIATHFPDASLKEADLTIYGELKNATDTAVDGVASATLGGVRVEQKVELAPHEDKTVEFSPDKFPQLRVRDPQIWWPWQMGQPHLETLTLRFVADGRLSDEQSARVGIREVTSELTDKGHRLFRVNGKPILIRGGGWSQDMLLRQDPARLREQFRMVRDMRLNAIRLEGKLDTEDFFRLADENGILVMAGWCCCDMWEHWNQWTPETVQVATESLRSQMLRIRSHASLLVWLNGSDNPPPADVESAYLKMEAETHWPNPTLSSASARPTSVSGESGVKMTGPYDYVAPSYWLADTSKHGGAWGFNTETSPGPAIPTLSSLRKFIPADEMWPPNATWSFHYGGGGFKELRVFNDAMDATYGQAKGLDDYVRTAQTMSYSGERAMFEAYGRNKYTSTGVIQWMLNNAWPSMIWHLYDYYLDAGGGYFGAKKALEPLHVQYSYDDHSVYVVNSTYEASPELAVTAKVFDVSLKELASKETSLKVDADSSTRAIELPDSVFAPSGSVYFVELVMKDNKGDTVSRNFYWAPGTLTTWDWAKTNYTHTPALVEANMQVLRSLPKTRIEASAVRTAAGVRVGLHNPSKELAFQVEVAAQDGHGDDITQVLWSDNYVELMPGESLTLSGADPERLPERSSVVVSGWNIPQTTLPLK
jgi:exo-1,4-beta-D-glucosaminidase